MFLNLAAVARALDALDELNVFVFMADVLVYDVELVVLFLYIENVTAWFCVPDVVYVGAVLQFDLEAAQTPIAYLWIALYQFDPDAYAPPLTTI